MQRDISIPWNPHQSSLQIQTNSTLGSDVKMSVWVYDSDDSTITVIAVLFSSPMQYRIYRCTNWDELVGAPDEVEKIWTIVKTETTLIISCNDVEVVNFQYTDSSMGYCELEGSVVNHFKFSGTFDQASQFYRAVSKASKYVGQPSG